MRSRRLLVFGPEGERLWVRIYVQPIGKQWAAMIMPDEASPPSPGELKGAVLFADTAEEAEARAVAYVGEIVPQD